MSNSPHSPKSEPEPEEVLCHLSIEMKPALGMGGGSTHAHLVVGGAGMVGLCLRSSALEGAGLM